MTAVEKLEAAIAKLEAVKQATPGTWEVDTNAPFSRDLVGIFAPELKEYAVKFDDDDQPDRDVADAIVTLRRTVDAQLDFLRTARGVAGARLTGEIAELVVGHGVQFADAILGGA